MENTKVERITPDQARETIGKLFALPIAACRELEDYVHSVANPWSGRPVETPDDGIASADNIIALEFARATKTYAAGVELAECGFGEQAAMLNRSLFEGMAVAHWVHANGEDATARFNDAYQFDRHLAAELLEEVGWATEEDAQAIAEAKLGEDELVTARKAFGNYGERMWTGHGNIWKLTESIEDQWTSEATRDELWRYLRVAHRDNNQMLHSTVTGLSRSASGFDDEGGRFWFGPSSVFIGKALIGAFWSYSNLLTLVVSRFDLGDKDELDALTERSGSAFASLEPEDVKHLGRNDRCPCDSGRKYKHCHEDQVKAWAALASR